MNAIILTYKHPIHAGVLYSKFSKLGLNVKIVHATDENVDGYEGMCSRGICHNGKRTTAWDLAFKDISCETTWFVEDDVAFTEQAFSNLLEETSGINVDLITNKIRRPEDDLYWSHRKTVCHVDKRMYSFNPLCRCSPNLISKILDYRNKHGQFSFHEILLPSLAETRFDLKELKRISFEQFRWNDIAIPLMGNDVSFYHPIKTVSDYVRLSRI
jgi:hypothetical protein